MFSRSNMRAYFGERGTPPFEDHTFQWWTTQQPYPQIIRLHRWPNRYHVVQRPASLQTTWFIATLVIAHSQNTTINQPEFCSGEKYVTHTADIWLRVIANHPMNGVGEHPKKDWISCMGCSPGVQGFDITTIFMFVVLFVEFLSADITSAILFWLCFGSIKLAWFGLLISNCHNPSIAYNHYPLLVETVMHP